MSFRVDTCNETTTWNKYGWQLRWPRAWIIILGVILFSLSLYIVGMEVGHTVYDSRRSTAFGGFIIFIPLMICAIFVLITACIPNLTLLRLAITLCCIMILLCIVLIIYDVFVLIDPTRCFLLSCTNADITYEVNSTYRRTITGWPIDIPWPDDFQTYMSAKRLFQSIQLFCACLFIFFSSLYICTSIIYRKINIHRSIAYRTADLYEASSQIVHAYPQYNYDYVLPTSNIGFRASTPKQYTYSTISPQMKTSAFVWPQISLINSNDICRRCMARPRMISTTTNYGRQNLFSYVCVHCNNELLNYHPTLSNIYPVNDSIWSYS